MTKRAGVPSCLFLLALSVFGLVACGGAEKETSAQVPVQDIPPWLLQGGDISRASLMKEWKTLDENDRLASSADLVTFQLRRTNVPIPLPADLAAMAISLESRLSTISQMGDRDEEYMGSVVDEIWPTMQ